MEAQQEVNSSSFKSASWQKLSPAWDMVRDLWGSPLDIRNQKTKYLSEFNKEPSKKYQERLNLSVFENEFRNSIEAMSGMVFRSDPQPSDIHPEMELMLRDIDLNGNSFWLWNLEKFQYFLRDGNGHIYIDLPSFEPPKDGSQVTKKDREGHRPWFVFYEASQVISSRQETINGIKQYTQVVLEESVVVSDGEFGEKLVVQHRVLRPGYWEIRQKNDKDEFIKATGPGSSGTTNLDFIPFYSADRLDAEPPFLTLAMLNILYYNKSSDYDDVLKTVCSPKIVEKYNTEADAKAAASLTSRSASSAVGIRIWGENANVFFAEISGSGLAQADKRMNDVEKRMAALGYGMLAPNDMATIRTAAEVLDNAVQRQSRLAGYARKWENLIEKALYGTAVIINGIKGKVIDLSAVEETTRMKMKMDYDRLTFSQEQLSFIKDLVDSGMLSLDTFLHWLPMLVDLPPGFDPELEKKKIAAFGGLIEEEVETPNKDVDLETEDDKTAERKAE